MGSQQGIKAYSETFHSLLCLGFAIKGKEMLQTRLHLVLMTHIGLTIRVVRIPATAAASISSAVESFCEISQVNIQAHFFTVRFAAIFIGEMSKVVIRAQFFTVGFAVDM